MVICSKCQGRAKWICKCTNKNLCEIHLGEHLRNHYLQKSDPDLIQVEFELSNNEMQSFRDEIKRRIHIIEGFKKRITKDTSDFIKNIENLYKDAIKNLDDALAEYQELISKKYFDQNEKNKIDRIIKVSIDPLSIQEPFEMPKSAIDYYKTNLLKEIEYIQANIVEKLYSEFGLCVQGHTGYVYCVAISKDNKYVASGSVDRKIIIWNINNQVQEYFLEGHTGSIFSLAFTPDA